MLVDSKGSRKPLARPTATQFLTHGRGRTPGAKRICRGSASGSPSRFFISSVVASSSPVKRLE